VLVLSGDSHDFRLVNNFARHTTWLHGPATAYAKFGVVVFGLLLVVGWWQARSTGDSLKAARALLAGVGVLIGVAVNQPLVHTVNERRPYAHLSHVLVLVSRSADASFPSDHATMAGAAVVGLLLVNRVLGIVATVLAVLMAAARVYVGAHYPADVVAGLALGALVAVAVQLAGPLLAPGVARVRGPLRTLVSHG
jgi:membrane-associated phospholipid phosphatase